MLNDLIYSIQQVNNSGRLVLAVPELPNTMIEKLYMWKDLQGRLFHLGNISLRSAPHIIKFTLQLAKTMKVPCTWRQPAFSTEEDQVSITDLDKLGGLSIEKMVHAWPKSLVFMDLRGFLDSGYFKNSNLRRSSRELTEWLLRRPVKHGDRGETVHEVSFYSSVSTHKYYVTK